MTIKQTIDQVLREQLGCHAAWPPLTTSLELGDYGVWSGGVFVRLGNIRSLGVALETRTGQPVSLSFISQTRRERRIQGGVTVQAFTASDVEGSLELRFDKEHSVILKCGTLTVSEIEDVPAVAAALRNAPGFRYKYKIVRSLFTADNAAVLSTTAPDATLSLGGSGAALRQFDLGEVSAGLRLGRNTHAGLEILGVGGPIGMGLFKVRRFGGGVAVAGSAPPDEAAFEEVIPGDPLPEEL